MTPSVNDPSGTRVPLLDGNGGATFGESPLMAGLPVIPHVILMIEDDHTVAHIFRDILEEDGYAVLHADRGDAALAILATPSCRVELVLLDLILPDVDGLDLLGTIRERARDPRLPVIVATARGLPADRAAAIKGHADDFLVKPVLPEELLLKVRILLLHRRLERQALQLAAFCRMAKAVNSCLHLNAVLERGLEHALAALAADGGIIRVAAGAQGDLSLKTHHGIPLEVLERLVRTRPGPELLALPSPLVVPLSAPPPGASPSFRAELGLFREAGYGGAMLIPLETKTAEAGILSIYTRKPPAIAEPDLPFLTAVGDLISTAMENAHLHRAVTSRALSDAVTGLPNRRHFEHRLREEVRRALRARRPLAVLLLDVDHFKRVNDGWGHRVGDQVLRQVGARLRAPLRGTDLIARYGGEEFAALLPETPLPTAVQVAERLRQAVEGHAYASGTPRGALRMTISIGVAMVPEDGAAPEVVLERADRALYRAKAGGRNCVCAATDAPAGIAGPR